MAKLTKEQVAEELEKINFNWIGNEYKNLDSLLLVECEVGHTSLLSIKKARKGYECPTCKETEVALEGEREFDILQTKKGIRVLGIDGATKTSGWAIIEDDKLLSSGIKEEKNPCHIHRIAKMRQWLLSMIEVYDIDVVVIEDVYISFNKQTAIMLAKLLGVLENASYSALGVKPIVISASTWKSHCGVKGRKRAEQKENAQNFVKKKYGIVASQDRADAICVATYGSYASKLSDDKMIQF